MKNSRPRCAASSTPCWAWPKPPIAAACGCWRNLEQSAPCGNCDNCLNPPPVWDGTDATARKLLSTIYRVHEASGLTLGTGHIRWTSCAGILVQQFRHDKALHLWPGARTTPRRNCAVRCANFLPPAPWACTR